MNHHVRLSVSLLCLLSGASGLLSARTQSFDGLYGGGELGGNISYANQTIKNNVDLYYESVSLFNSAEPYGLDSSMVRTAAAGSLFAGYGRTWKKLYLGGELMLSNSYYKMTNSSNAGLSRVIQGGTGINIASNESIDTQVSMSPVQFSLSLRPGIMVSPTSLLFARVGASFATLRYYTHVTAIKSLGTPTEVINFPITMQGSSHAHRTALQLGGGLEQAINDRLNLRLDYLFSLYGKMRVATAQSTTIEPVVMSATGSQSANIYTQSMMLGLVYYFNV